MDDCCSLAITVQIRYISVSDAFSDAGPLRVTSPRANDERQTVSHAAPGAVIRQKRKSIDGYRNQRNKLFEGVWVQCLVNES